MSPSLHKELVDIKAFLLALRKSADDGIAMVDRLEKRATKPVKKTQSINDRVAAMKVRIAAGKLK